MKNFLENPLWRTDIRDKRYKFSIELPNGIYIYEAKEDNIPDDIDALFLYYFLFMSQKVGRSTIRMTRYRVLKDCNFPPDKKSYERLKTALKRWATVNVTFSGSFYVVKKIKHKKEIVEKKVKRYEDRFFHIFSASIIREENEKGSQKGQVKISFDPEFLRAIDESSFIKDIDLSVFIALRTSFARRLYEWLPKQFIGSNSYAIGAEKFFDKVRMVPTTYPSVMKRKLNTVNSALKRINKFDKRFEYKVRLEGEKTKKYAFIFNRIRKSEPAIEENTADDGQLSIPIPGEDENTEIKPLKAKDEETIYQETFQRLVDFGLDEKTSSWLLENNSCEGINNILDHITDRYLHPWKYKKPIKKLKSFIATCIGLPKGTILKKPKLQEEQEKALEAARIKEEQETRALEEREELEALSNQYKNQHRKIIEDTIKEVVKKKGLKWSEVRKGYKNQAPEYVLNHLDRLTKPGETMLKPYSEVKAFKKDPMIREGFFHYLQTEFLTEEDSNFEMFVKENATEEEYNKIAQVNFWGEESNEVGLG